MEKNLNFKLDMKEKLNELQQQIGKTIHRSEWVTISQEQINRFADATGDHQWIHIDEQRAKEESPYQSTIAHGFLTLSLLPKLQQTGTWTINFPPTKQVINYGLNKVRFPNAVRVNRKIRSHAILQSVTEIRGGFQITQVITIEVEEEEKPACVAETMTRFYV